VITPIKSLIMPHKYHRVLTGFIALLLV